MATSDPALAPDENGGGGAATRQPQTVGERKRQYLVGQPTGPGIRPFDLNLLEQSFNQNPNIEVIRKLSPPGIAGVFADGLGGEGTQSVIVARMTDDVADRLKTNAGPALVVEEDAPVSFAMPGPPAAGVEIPDPGVFVPTSVGFAAKLTVTGTGGSPVTEAEVFLYGSVWPAQGVTDNKGKVQLTLFGESPESLTGLYVKPKRGYWSLWIPRPFIDPTQDNIVPLTPLDSTFENFPGEQVLGWGQQAMRLDKVPADMRGRGVKVAVIDSGGATSHQDLKNELIGGYDIASQNDQSWSEDLISHGSHCTGIIAAADNGRGIRGFAPEASVYAYKIFPGGRFSDVIDALNHCIDQQIDVANLSLGTDQRSQLVEQKLKEAKEAGVACIVATGNSGDAVKFPAVSQHVLAVAAIGKRGAYPPESYHTKNEPEGSAGVFTAEGYYSAGFTCFGPEVAVCAPGVAILSTVPADDYAAWDGTSMATPHVTGLAALVLAHHPDFHGANAAYRARDGRRVERLFQVLKESARPINLGDSNRTGAGLPDAPTALGVEPVLTAATPDLLGQLLGLLRAAGPTGTNGHGQGTTAPSSTNGVGTRASIQDLAASLGNSGLAPSDEGSVATLSVPAPGFPAASSTPATSVLPGGQGSAASSFPIGAPWTGSTSRNEAPGGTPRRITLVDLASAMTAAGIGPAPSP